MRSSSEPAIVAAANGSTPTVGSWLRGKYRLDRVLGEGGMATVFAATHRNKKRVAVKLLKTEVASLDLVRRFVREGYAANTVEHPGVVSVLDDDVCEGGAPFLVMELLEGESLEDASERRGARLDVDEVLSFAHQVLDVLAAAHARNVVHRDIKPANVFVTTSGQIKVLDFGIARIREGHGNASETSTGQTLGTPAFMAPEQARGKASEVGPHTDVWALGASMFTILLGRNVHEGESVHELVYHCATRPAPSLGSVMKDAPAPLVEVIDRALAFDPKDRWPDAAAMRDAVERAYQAIFDAPISAEPLVRLVSGRVRIAASDPKLAISGHESNAATLDEPRSPASSLAIFTTTTPPKPARERRVLLPVGGALLVLGCVALAAGTRRTATAMPEAPRTETVSVAPIVVTIDPPPLASSAPAPKASIAPLPVVKAASSGSTPLKPVPPPPSKVTKAADWDRQ